MPGQMHQNTEKTIRIKHLGEPGASLQIFYSWCAEELSELLMSWSPEISIVLCFILTAAS